MAGHGTEVPSQVLEELMSLYAVDPDSPLYRRNIEAGLTRNLLQDPLIRESYVKKVLDDCAARTSARVNALPIKMKQKLTQDQQASLKDEFGLFNLDFSAGTDSGPHAFHRAHRQLTKRRMMHELKITPTTRPINGYDVALKDVGGNPVPYLNAGQGNVHCCCPVLSDDDARRHAAYEFALRHYVPTEKTARLYEKHHLGSALVRCSRKGQNCRVTAGALIFIHSTYDMSPTDIADAMYVSNASIAKGCFHFSPQVLLYSSGTLSNGLCFRRYVRKGTKTSIRIRFFFERDPQNGYDHDWINYLSLVSCFRLSSSVHRDNPVHYTLSFDTHANDVMCFTIHRIVSDLVPVSRPFRVLTDPELNKHAIVYYWRYETLLSDSFFNNTANHLRPIRLVVPTNLLNRLLSYADGLPDAKFTIKNLVVAATAFNSREIISGQSVGVPDPVSPSDLKHLCNAVWLLTYISNYECSQTLSYLVNQETDVRKQSGVSRLLNLFRRSSPQYAGSAANQLYKDATAESREEMKQENSIMNMVANLFRQHREFAVGYFDEFVQYFTVEEELEMIKGSPALDASVEEPFNLRASFSKAVIRSAVDATLPTENDEPRVCYTEYENPACELPVQVIPNEDNGNCALRAALDVGVEGGSPAAMRTRLSNSVHLREIANRDLVSQLAVTDGSPAGHLSLDVFLLIALEYDVAICLHTPGKNYLFGRRDAVPKHIRVVDAHAEGLRVQMELEDIPCYGYETVRPPRSDYSPVVVEEAYDAFFKDIDTQVKKNHYRSIRHFADPFGAIQRGGYLSRSGLKTAEMFKRFFRESIETAVSVGGPGGEVQFLTEIQSCRVIGVTLLRPNTPDFDPSLNRIAFTPNYGCDASGDITQLCNVVSISHDVHNAFPGGADFFGGDACSDKDFPVGDARREWIAANENVIRYEVLLASCCLRNGGNAYFKVFSLVSDTMAMLLYLLNEGFDEVYVAKLNMSRAFSTELHVICRGYRSDRGVFRQLLHGTNVTDVMRERTLALQAQFDARSTNALAVLKRVYYSNPNGTRITANVPAEIEAFYVSELARTTADVPVGLNPPPYVARLLGAISADPAAELEVFFESTYPERVPQESECELGAPVSPRADARAAPDVVELPESGDRTSGEVSRDVDVPVTGGPADAIASCAPSPNEQEVAPPTSRESADVLDGDEVTLEDSTAPASTPSPSNFVERLFQCPPPMPMRIFLNAALPRTCAFPVVSKSDVRRTENRAPVCATPPEAGDTRDHAEARPPAEVREPSAVVSVAPAEESSSSFPRSREPAEDVVDYSVVAFRKAYHPDDSHPAPVADRRPWYQKLISDPPTFTEAEDLSLKMFTKRAVREQDETVPVPPHVKSDTVAGLAPVPDPVFHEERVEPEVDFPGLHPQLAVTEYLGSLKEILKAELSNHKRVMTTLLGTVNAAEYLRLEKGGYILVEYIGNGAFVDVYRGFKHSEAGYRKAYCKGGFRLITPTNTWDGFRAGDRCLFSDYCVLALEEELIRAVEKIEYNVTPEIDFVQAGPGCGKTTDILKTCTPPNLKDASNVLISTREGREDFVRKLMKKYPQLSEDECRGHIRTVTSFLTNTKKNQRSETLYIDEALMSHPGMLFVAICMAKPKTVVMYGDTQQIPVVNFTPSFRMKYMCLTDFVRITRVLTKTYRCPADVALRLDPLYRAANAPHGFDVGLQGVRGTTNSCFVERLSNDNVPTGLDAQYLTFTQLDKMILKSKGVKGVSTVHEFQGKEADNIVVVRLDSNAQSELFLRRPYAVVAISRHRKKLVYYTRVTTDALAKMIKEVPSDEAIVKSHAPVGAKLEVFSAHRAPSEYKTLNIERTCVDWKADVDKMFFVPRHGYFGDAGERSGKPADMDGDVYVVNKSRTRVYFVVACDNPGDRMSLKVLRKSFASLRSVLAGTAQNIIYLSGLALEHVGMTELSQTLHRDIPRRVVVCAFNTKEEVAPQVFSLLNTNGINTIDNKEVVSLEYYEPEFVDAVPDSAPSFVLSSAQNFLDSCFGPITFDDQSMDSYMVRTFDLQLDIGAVTYSRIAGGFPEKCYDSMCPAITSPVPFRRSYEYREQLLALGKRNRNSPYTTGTVDIMSTAVEMVDNAITRCFDAEALRAHNNDGVRISAGSIHEWLKKQDPSVIDMIGSEHCLSQTALDNYSFSIKPTPKPNLTIDASASYLALQTIVYHEKHINAMFCQVFREVKKRVILCLKKHIKMFADVSVAEFEEILNRDVPCNNLTMFEKLEVDISKYDKSQMEVALECDCEFLRRFGVDERIVKLWRYCHIVTHVRNRNTRLSTTIAYQRKSGDASTFLGNTLFLLAVLADRIPLDEMHMVLVSGDDSLIVGSALEQYKDTQHFGLKFNLDVKFFTFDNSYFCSKFLLPVGGRWTFTPDPLKLITKLGRHDLVNRAHVEEYRVSFVDNCVNFRSAPICVALGRAVMERYQICRDFSGFFRSIPSLFEPAAFQALFSEPPSGRVDDRKYFNGYDF